MTVPPATGLGRVVRHVAELQGLSMWGHDDTAEQIADAVLSAAVQGAKAVAMETHLAARESATIDRTRVLRRACAAEVERDRTLTRVQAVLSALDDRELAGELAGSIGVLLLPVESS